MLLHQGLMYDGPALAGLSGFNFRCTERQTV